MGYIEQTLAHSSTSIILYRYYHTVRVSYISSMTAFARVQVQESWGGLVWEIRSVNHRYLEPQFRLPEQMREISALRSSLKKTLKQGKIECHLKLALLDNTEKLLFKPFVLAQLHSALSQIQQTFGDTAEVNALDILRWHAYKHLTVDTSELASGNQQFW